jgi:hypothetical protein
MSLKSAQQRDQLGSKLMKQAVASREKGESRCE